ncbi:MAG: hypothetical protein A3G76_07260 [Acidobacteria bacterium RIFCSPLOWO2_12_FULL_65_11]|nr:MAG: hypothetical protein A3H95_05250 [Acidobacteria bacterium RIFCSPLOWO2_02_FULL_64_15]OFW28883.1 MAG: hypothetical protein A3G76_07260 [Acidobacteria bacterium RIFCSPLOWO2_12_FULL_65_11]
MTALDDRGPAPLSGRLVGSELEPTVGLARHALIVDTDARLLSNLRSLAETVGYRVIGRTDFEAGRHQLRIQAPAVLVANIRREAQRAGAFYEEQVCLPRALKGYLTASLPPRDRRDVSVADRRMTFRKGRRVTDGACSHA